MTQQHELTDEERAFVDTLAAEVARRTVAALRNELNSLAQRLSAVENKLGSQPAATVEPVVERPHARRVVVETEREEPAAPERKSVRDVWRENFSRARGRRQ